MKKNFKIEIEGYVVHVKGNEYTIIYGPTVIKGNIDDLMSSQRSWIDNTHACMVSLLTTLGFDRKTFNL